MSKLNDAKKVIKAFYDQKETANTDTTEAMQNAEKEMLYARQKMQEALLAADLKAHREAKTAYNEAKEALDFYREKEAVSGFISESEYVCLRDGIHAEVDKKNETAKEKIVSILEDLEGMADDLRDFLNDADSTLQKLQADVYEYKDAPGYLRSGRLVMTKAEDARLKDPDYCLLFFLTDAINKARDYGILPTVKEL